VWKDKLQSLVGEITCIGRLNDLNPQGGAAVAAAFPILTAMQKLDLRYSNF
jgi:hypothetical protein